MCRLLGPCQIIIFIYLMIQHPGYAAKRPVMTVIPNYNKILTGEKITMTCGVESDASGCSWYHENILIYTGKDYVISMTEIRHSGDYRCQNSAGERSEIVTLNVTTGQVILQAPVYIYEGDDVSLRCYSPYFANQTIFYKNNQMIQNNDSDLLPIKSTDLTSTYRCSKQVLRTFSKTYSSDDTSITYTEGNSVIFTPEYNKLLTGENITMTYDGGFGVTHYWYKDSEKVAEGRSYTITSAQVGHSGVYDCRTKSRNSAKFRLDVSDGPVILQAPPLVYTGSDMVLRCHSRPGYRVINTTFYKDGDVIQPSTNDLATVIIPQNQQVGRYRCTRTLSWEEYVTYTDEVSLHIRELFPKPNISIEQNTVREGDNIICNTSLSLPQKGTLLQFTFYRDGQEVLNLNSSSKVLNVRLEDSGNYSCEVRTANNTGERKRSAELYIHIQELFSRPNLTTIQNPVTKGDAMILICNTSLSPLRQSTELQFAFYRDGQNVQKFSLSNQYVVQSTELEDSGNYSCDVRTPNNNVKKRSEEVSIQIKEYEHHSTAALVTISVITILLIIIIIINLIIVNKNKCKPLITSTSKRQTADPQETDSHRDLSAEGNVCYADIKINRKAPATHTASNEDLCYVNFTTSRTASSPTVVETQIIYSEIKPRTEI